MRGYDLDGVMGKIKPKKPYVIISGRLYDEWGKTIKEVGTDVPIYLRPSGKWGDEISAGLWKAEMINKLDITEYYEDSFVQIQIIQGNCPNCKVIKIRGK